MSLGTVFPIGHYCGTAPPTVGPDGSGTDESPDDHLVRVGEALERLTDDEFGIWMLAHGLADIGRGDWSARDIAERATDARIDDPAGRIEALLDRGLLAHVPGRPTPDESTAFASAYRVVPLLVGLGTVPGRPDQHAIGVPGVGTAALLDPACYELWRQGALAGTLWQLCQERVVASTSAGSAGALELVDPARLLGVLFGELRVLIVHGCAYLDVAAPEQTAVRQGPGDTAVPDTPVPDESGEPGSAGPTVPDRTGTAPGGNMPE